MLTKEVFEYFQKINVVNEKPIPYELFLPVRHKINFSDATNGAFEDKDGAIFWNYLDNLMDQNLINSVHYVMEDLWSISNSDESEDELFRSSEDAYLIYILFKTPRLKDDVEKQIVNNLNEKFSAECHMHHSFGDGVWFITWD